MPEEMKTSKEEALKKIQAAGVAGMGGGGFPTHVKLAADVDTVIANGVECEPLLWSDKNLMLAYPDDVVEGLGFAMELTGARKGIVAIKAKNQDVASAMEKAVRRRRRFLEGSVELALLPNNYPMGDEFVLVQQVLQRTIPEMGLPLNVGAAVCNTATLKATAAALKSGEPLTSRIVTVAGAVGKPVTAEVPVGTPYSFLLELAGGTPLRKPHFIDGGPMMGTLSVDPGETIQKTTSGILVLPGDHQVVRRHLIDSSNRLRTARAACCLCNECTQVCPRNALGHRIHPDRLMRSVASGITHDLEAYTGAFYCCECGLCTVYGCPMYLDPCGMNIEIKKRLRSSGVKPDSLKKSKPDRFFYIKQVPVSRLVSRLGLKPLEIPCTHLDRVDNPPYVVLKTDGCAGAPSKPIVKKGDRVQKGDLIAEPDGNVSTALHAGIDGTVEWVVDRKIKITAPISGRTSRRSGKTGSSTDPGVTT